MEIQLPSIPYRRASVVHGHGQSLRDISKFHQDPGFHYAPGGDVSMYNRLVYPNLAQPGSYVNNQSACYTPKPNLKNCPPTYEQYAQAMLYPVNPLSSISYQNGPPSSSTFNMYNHDGGHHDTATNDRTSWNCVSPGFPQAPYRVSAKTPSPMNGAVSVASRTAYAVTYQNQSYSVPPYGKPGRNTLLQGNQRYHRSSKGNQYSQSAPFSSPLGRFQPSGLKSGPSTPVSCHTGAKIPAPVAETPYIFSRNRGRITSLGSNLDGSHTSEALDMSCSSASSQGSSRCHVPLQSSQDSLPPHISTGSCPTKPKAMRTLTSWNHYPKNNIHRYNGQHNAGEKKQTVHNDPNGTHIQPVGEKCVLKVLTAQSVARGNEFDNELHGHMKSSLQPLSTIGSKTVENGAKMVSKHTVAGVGMSRPLNDGFQSLIFEDINGPDARAQGMFVKVNGEDEEKGPCPINPGWRNRITHHRCQTSVFMGDCKPKLGAVYYIPVNTHIPQNSIIHFQKKQDGFYKHPCLAVQYNDRYIWFYAMTKRPTDAIIELGMAMQLEHFSTDDTSSSNILKLANGSAKMTVQSWINLGQLFKMEREHLGHWGASVWIAPGESAKLCARIAFLEKQQNRFLYRPVMRDMRNIEPGTIVMMYNEPNATTIGAPAIVLDNHYPTYSFMRVKDISKNRNFIEPLSEYTVKNRMKFLKVTKDPEEKGHDGTPTLLLEDDSPALREVSAVEVYKKTQWQRFDRTATWCVPPVKLTVQSVQMLKNYCVELHRPGGILDSLKARQAQMCAPPSTQTLQQGPKYLYEVRISH